MQELRPDQPLEEQIGFNVKKNNRRIARAIELNEVEGTDLGTFLDIVLELCEGRTPIVGRPA